MRHAISNDYDDEREPADRATSAEDVTTSDRRACHFRPARSRASMLLAGVMLAGLGGLYYTCLKTGPQLAAAESFDNGPAGQTINTFIATGPVDVKQLDHQIKTLQTTAARFQQPPGDAQVPLNALKTNPFQDPEAATDIGQQRTAVLRAVQSYRLQSIIINSKNRSCMINDAMYLEGQPLDRFTVDQITPDGVILHSGPWRFELKQR